LTYQRKTSRSSRIYKNPQAVWLGGFFVAFFVQNSFEYFTRQWFASNTHTVREITLQKKVWRFELYVFPVIGSNPVSESSHLMYSASLNP